jgi:hypothetical protein
MEPFKSVIGKRRAIEALLEGLEDYVRTFDWEVYAPLGHGTTEKRGELVKKNGLLTRGDFKRKEDNWNVPGISGEDRIYFETCLESEDIGLTACKKAHRLDNPSELLLNEDVECRYFTLKDPGEYADRMVKDEDNEEMERVMEIMYSDRPEKIQNQSFFHPLFIPERIEHLPRELMDYFDLIYAYGTRDAEGNVKEIGEAIDIALPILNVGGWGTTAVRGSIPPEDLEEWIPSEYLRMKEGEDCERALDNGIVKMNGVQKGSRTRREIAPGREQDSPHWKVFEYKGAEEEKRREIRRELRDWIKGRAKKKLRRLLA